MEVYNGQGFCNALHSSFESIQTFFIRIRVGSSAHFIFYQTAAKTQHTSLNPLFGIHATSVQTSHMPECFKIAFYINV